MIGILFIVMAAALIGIIMGTDKPSRFRHTYYKRHDYNKDNFPFY